MKRKTSNAPYPILYPADEAYAAEQGYVQAHFDITQDPDVRINAQHDLEIDFDFDLTDDTLSRLVASGDALYYVNVESGYTYYRRAFVQADTHFSLTIPHRLISDTVEIFVGLVAARPLAEFTSASFAERFGRATFDLEKGDLMAVGTGWVLDLQSADGSSDTYIYISRDVDASHPDLWTNGAGDKLIVNLADRLYDIYFRRRNTRHKAELIALVLKPAILSALQSEIIKARADGTESTVEVQSHRWLRKLNEALGTVLADEGLAWNINDVLIDGDRDSSTLAYAVDKLLQRPLAKALAEMDRPSTQPKEDE